jgi:hypothetical protein
LRIVTYDEIDRAEWGKLVRESETGTWFQSPEAYVFFASMPDLSEPFCIAVEQVSELSSERKLCGVCVGYVTKEKGAVRQYFTRRAIIHGGVCLCKNAANDEVKILLTAVRNKLKDKTIYIETRNFNDYSRWKEAFEDAGFAYKKHLNFHVDCRDEKQMWERLSDNRRRQVRKGGAVTDDGLPVMENGVREDDVRAWYGILEQLYRTKVKTPLWPVEFFLEAYRQGIGRFLLVKHEGKVIGGSMVVWDRGAVTGDGLPVTGDEVPHEGVVYEWFECGLNAEYKEQYPSVMATWAGMNMAHAQGCARYDMMGAGEPGVPYGVRDFKREFGGELVEHGRFLCICKPWLYRLGAWGVRMLKR